MFREPMLAKSGDPRVMFPGARLVMEPKLDGHRLIVSVEADGVRAYARSGVDKTKRLPTLCNALSGLPVGTVLDGEAVVLNATGGDWSATQSILAAQDGRDDSNLTFVAFDVLSLMGEDVTLHPLAQRRLFLEALVERVEHSRIIVVPQYEYHDERVQRLIGEGWEGAIVKSTSGQYRPGKRDWCKIKGIETADVVVTGATPGKGKYEGLIGALTFDGGQFSGFSDAERAEFTTLQADGTLAGIVCEIRYFGKHPSGGYKSPQYLRRRLDKEESV